MMYLQSAARLKSVKIYYGKGMSPLLFTVVLG